MRLRPALPALPSSIASKRGMQRASKRSTVNGIAGSPSASLEGAMHSVAERACLKPAGD